MLVGVWWISAGIAGVAAQRNSYLSKVAADAERKHELELELDAEWYELSGLLQ